MPLIRPFESADAEGVASVILRIQQEEFGIAVTRDDQPDLADITNYYQNGVGNFWVALSDGAVSGTIGLLDIGSGQAALRKMFVAEPWRGRTHGVAQALLDTLVQWSEARGLAIIYLGTTARFLAAHRFYEKNGFIEIPRSTLPPEFPVMIVDSKFYRRGIARGDA